MAEREISRRKTALEKLMALPKVPHLRRSYDLDNFSIEGTEYSPKEIAEIKFTGGERAVLYVAGISSGLLVAGSWLSSGGFIKPVNSFYLDQIVHYKPLPKK